MPEYYSKYGKEITMMEWAKLLDNLEYKRVGRTKLWWGGGVSTVWMGLDHNFTGGTPIIFETMVFGWKVCKVMGRRYRPDLDQERYSGLGEARKGHERLVKKWRNPIMALLIGR